MTASLKIFVLWWTVVAGVSLTDNEDVAEPRSSMLGIYFNPNDPISRLAANWVSRLFEKISDVKPTADPKPTAPDPGSQPSEGQNGVPTTTAKPPPPIVQLLWPPIPGMMPQPGGGQYSYYPKFVQPIPYPQPPQQGQPILNMQGQPPFVHGQQNQGGYVHAQPELQPIHANQAPYPSQGQAQFVEFPPVHPQTPQLPPGINIGTQYPAFPGSHSIPWQPFQPQQLYPSGPNSQPRPQQFPNTQQSGQFPPHFPVPGQQQQPQFQPPNGLPPFPLPNQVYPVRAPDGTDGAVISMGNLVIDGQSGVANVTAGIILNSGTVNSNIQDGAKVMQVIPLHSMLLVFPLRSNASDNNVNEAALVEQNAESISNNNTTMT